MGNVELKFALTGFIVLKISTEIWDGDHLNIIPLIEEITMVIILLTIAAGLIQLRKPIIVVIT